jgi:drug/metabolite transporter (DMT)-like permease
MLTILTGLSTSLCYATSDMLSQRVTRGTRPLTQVLWVLAVGTVIIVPVTLIVEGVPDPGQWRGAALAALAGVIYFFALYCLMRGLQTGDLGVVSVLNSLQGAYVVVVVIVLGAPVTPLGGLSLGLCVAGGLLTSIEGKSGSARGALWGLATGVLFAGLMLCFEYGNAPWLLETAISRSVSLAITLPVALLTGSVAVPKALRPTAAASGILELIGLMLLTITFSLGPATVAGVTTTQFGTFAVILGFALLRERPKPNQWAGIVCTVLGVSLLAVAL